jgi:hypothetical protein
VLKELAGRKKLHNLSLMHDFTFCYDAHFASFADVQEEGFIADPPHSLNRSPVPCTALLALCLIEFLKLDINKVRKYILKCKMCKKCFITKKIDPRTKYCSTCSKKNKIPKEKLSAYDKNMRSILKKRKEVQKRTRSIKEIMERLNCNEKEAMEYYEADKEVSTE